MHHFEKKNSERSLDLDCHRGHSSRAGRDSKSPNSHTKLCSSTSVSQPKQDLTFTEPSSIASKSACQNSIVLTPSEQLSPPPSPLYLPFAPPVSPPSSPLRFTTAFSVCSPGSLPHQFQLHKPRALPELWETEKTSQSLNLDTREVFPPSQTTWRPWSWNGMECWYLKLYPRRNNRVLIDASSGHMWYLKDIYSHSDDIFFNRESPNAFESHFNV